MTTNKVRVSRPVNGLVQRCVDCNASTGRCEDDSIFTEEGHGPLCYECWHKTPEYKVANDLI